MTIFFQNQSSKTTRLRLLSPMLMHTRICGLAPAARLVFMTRPFTLGLALCLSLALAVVTHGAPAASTPGLLIKADYQTKAAVVMGKLDETLTKQVALVAAELLKTGDVPGAEQATAQLKQKLSGQVVQGPHPAISLLFSQYDSAVTRALQPLQQAALAKIETALKSSVARDADVVAELGRVQAEIADTPVVAAIPRGTSVTSPAPAPQASTAVAAQPDIGATARQAIVRGTGAYDHSRYWSSSVEPGKAPQWVLVLEPDSTWCQLSLEKEGRRITGTWKESSKTELHLITGSEDWVMTTGADQTGRLERPDSSVRHLTVLGVEEARQLLARAAQQPVQRPDIAAGLRHARLWTYHVSPDSESVADVQLDADGVWRCFVPTKNRVEFGTWEPTAKKDVVRLSYGTSSWNLNIEPDGRSARMHRPDSGPRFLKAVDGARL